MPRSLNPVTTLAVFLLCAAAGQAAIFPDQIGPFQKSAPKTIGIPDQPLYDEYGLEQTEAAEFTAPDKRHFSAVGWRFQPPPVVLIHGTLNTVS